jgi:hypothetical protein
MSTALVEFLRARLDEDASVARAATPGPWAVDNVEYAESILAADRTAVVGGGRWGGEASVFETTEDALHIARHDPERVLAEVETKRRIVFLAERLPELTASTDMFDNNRDAWAEVLKRLALPYADHPDYQGAWKP